MLGPGAAGTDSSDKGEREVCSVTTVNRYNLLFALKMQESLNFDDNATMYLGEFI